MASQKQEETDIWDFLKNLMNHWRIMIPCILIAGIVGVFIAFWIRPVYKVDALLQIETKNSKSSALMGGLGSLFNTTSPAETEIELIKSRQILGETVEKMHLLYYAEPINFLDRLLHREGRMEISHFEVPWDSLDSLPKKRTWLVEVTDENGGFALFDHDDKKVLSGVAGTTYKFPYARDSVTFGIFRMNALPGQKFEVRKFLRLNAINLFRSNFEVKEKAKKTGVLEFTYEDIYPDRGVEILNEIASSYLRKNVEERNAEAQKTLEFLEKQLPDVKAQMDSSLMNLNAYQNQVGSVDIHAETQIVLQRRTRLQQDILSIQQKKQEAIRLFHSDHPTVQTLEEQEKALQRELAGTSSQVKRLPAKQQEVLKLSSEVELSKILYTNMINNIQQLRLVSAGEVGSVRVVDFAEEVTRPVKPKKMFIVSVALFFGFCLGAALIAIKARFSSGVRSSHFIEKETGFSVYAKVPKGNPNGTKGTRPLAVVEPDDVAVEALRQLRSSLEFSLLDEQKAVIGISGLIPGVGKSFVSVNLAALYALMGKRVLLIDADLRKGRLHKEFGIKRGQGFSQVLLREAVFEDVVSPTEVENLFVLPCGQFPANPAELLGSKRYHDLIEDFNNKYDVVIIDTPPILLVTDAALACREASQIVMVVEYNKHSIEAIKEGMAQILKGSSNAHAAFVMNKYVHSRTENGGYKYGKY